MPITPYPDIEKLLIRLRREIQQLLNQKLIGLYLYGSLVTGDFDPDISDIDLLAVTTSDINAREFEQLRAMHHEVSAAYPQWQGRIEIQYLAAKALQTFKTDRSQIAVISPGEPFNIKEAGIDWLINWYIVREVGLVLLGPAPQTVILPISQEEFIQASRKQAEYWVEWARQPRDQRGQSYAILTMCRALYACQRGEQASKKAAASWTQQQFPQWAPLIQKALVWRKAADDELVEPDVTFPETAQFIHFVLDHIDNWR